MREPIGSRGIPTKKGRWRDIFNAWSQKVVRKSVPADSPAESGSMNEEMMTRPPGCAERDPSWSCTVRASKLWKAFMVTMCVELE